MTRYPLSPHDECSCFVSSLAFSPAIVVRFGLVEDLFPASSQRLGRFDELAWDSCARGGGHAV